MIARACRVHAVARVDCRWSARGSGFRPATPDKLPLIGAWPAMPGLWIAAGHEGLGITTSLGTAQLIADLVAGREPPIDAARVRADALHFTRSAPRDVRVAPSDISAMTMQQSQWAGVFPAITTPFHDDHSVDHDALAEHVRWLADAGAPASSPADRSARRRRSRSTRRCASTRRASARSTGASPSSPASPASRPPNAWRSRGPPSARGARASWPSRRTCTTATGARRASTTARSSPPTPLSCMLYNNPIAYRTDVLPGAAGRARAALRQPARGEGVERRRPSRHRGARAARRPARGVRRPRRHDPRGDRDGRRAAGSQGW